MRKTRARLLWAAAVILIAVPAAAYTYTTQVTLKFAGDVGGGANTGTLVIGNSTSRQIALDDNEIQARAANGGPSTLYVQHAGGDLQVGGNLGLAGDLSMSGALNLGGDLHAGIGGRDLFLGEDGGFTDVVLGNETFITDAPRSALLFVTTIGVVVTPHFVVAGDIKANTLATSGNPASVCADRNGLLILCPSRRELKADVSPLAAGLREVLAMRPVSFSWKESGHRDLGFVAEDAANVVPDLAVRGKADQIEGFNYPNYTAVLTRAVQEQQQVVEDLTSELRASRVEAQQQGSEIARRDQEMAELKNEVRALAAEVRQLRNAALPGEGAAQRRRAGGDSR